MKGSKMSRVARPILIAGIVFTLLNCFWPSSTFAKDYTQEAYFRVIDEGYITIYGLSVGDWDNDGEIELLANYDYYVPPLKTPELVAYVCQAGIYVEERRIPNISLQRSSGGGFIMPPVQLVISDVDNDGLNELIFPGEYAFMRSLHVLNVTPTTYSEEFSIPGDFFDVAVDDVNGDGLNELVAITRNTLNIYSVNESGYSLNWTTSVSGDLVRTGNVDGDPYNEIVVATGDVDVSVFGYDGSTYSLEGTGTSSGYHSMGIGLGDYDLDGNVEILRVGYHGAVVIYQQSGANWIVEDTWSVAGNDDPWYATSGNTDGDPFEEIIIAYGNYIHAESFQIFKYNASTSAYELYWTSGSLDGWGANLFVGDPDDDAHVELVTGSRAEGYIRVFSTEYVVIRPPRPPSNLRASLSGADFENVTLTWDLSPDDGAGAYTVTAYDIYRNDSYDPEGRGYVLYDSVPNGTNAYLDSIAGEGDPEDHFYFVCAYDVFDFSNCTETQAAKFTRPLSAGPNPVSIPLTQSDESIETVLQTLSWDRAWAYDSPSQEWKWQMSFKGYRRGLWNVNHTMGLWVNVTKDSNLTVAGVVPTETIIQLRDGWNFVGYPSFSDAFTLADLKGAIPVEKVESFDPSAPPCFLRVMQDLDEFLAGEGYWVRVTEDTSWTVSN